MIQDPFRSMIRSEGVLRYRDLPWRRHTRSVHHLAF